MEVLIRHCTLQGERIVLIVDQDSVPLWWAPQLALLSWILHARMSPPTSLTGFHHWLAGSGEV